MEGKKRSDFENEKDWLRHKQKILQARLNEIDQKDNAKKRKEETRKKIILGGAVLALQAKGHVDQALLDYVKETLPKKDHHLFPNLFK